MDEDTRTRMYESALLGILQNEGQIVPFLDKIFGFLYKCTDFYLVHQGPDAKKGFPPGVADKIVLSAFKKYQKVAELDQVQKQKVKAEKNAKMEPLACMDAGTGGPPVAKIVEISSENEIVPVDSINMKDSENMDSNSPSKTETVMDSKDEAAEESEEEDGDAKELKRIQKEFQSSSDSYNGAKRENYSWSQSIKDLDIIVPVLKSTTKKNLKVDLQHTHLTVSVVDEQETKVLVDGKFCWKINVEYSCWTLMPGKELHINLEKVDERWWDALMADEPKINVRNIDASRPMDDLGEDEQAKLHELMYNQQQKQMGKLTTDQQKVQNILKNAWDMDGSPFKGQPFDPSVVNISASGDMPSPNL